MPRGSRFLLAQVILYLVLALIWGGLAVTQNGEVQGWYIALVAMSLALAVIQFAMFRKNALEGHSQEKSDDKRTQ